jgi:beta-galactosidase/beta-glucuronidase
MLSVDAVSSQVTQALRDGWLLAPDPDNAGRQRGWQEAVQATARPAPVPGVAHQVWPDYTGVVWYWCRFRPLREATSAERYLLRFGAVMYLAEVWVNGVPVGGHEGGETPFVLDASGAVRQDSDNLLAVRVLVPTAEGIDGYRLAEVPSSNQRNYGGIVLPVELLVVPQVRIADLYARPRLDDGCTRLVVTVCNHGEAAAPGRIDAAVGPDKTGEVVERAGLEAEFPPGESRHLLELRVAQPRLWDLDDPYLYRVQAWV